MKFLYRLRDALARFMYGRNGADQLSWAMVIFSVLLELIASFLGAAPAVRSVLSFVSMAVWIIVLFRMFSRNLYKRRAENARFMQWWGPKSSAFRAAGARRQDKAHKYVKCSCGTYCRVPRGVGTVELTCPKCGSVRRVKT